MLRKDKVHVMMRIEQEIMVLLDTMLQQQKLGVKIQETPVLIYIEGSIYINAYLVDETEDYLSIVCLNEKGQEHAKVLNKSYISSIEIMYLNTKKEDKESKEVNMYG